MAFSDCQAPPGGTSWPMPSETAPTAQVVPPIPGFWRLGWLLFMQPIQLHLLYHRLELHADSSARQPRSRLRERAIRTLVLRFAAWLFIGSPVVALLCLAVALPAGVSVSWPTAFLAPILAVGLGLMIGVPTGVGFGVARGMPVGVSIGAAVGATFGVTFGIASAALFGSAFKLVCSVGFGSAWNVSFDAAFVVVFAAVVTMTVGVGMCVALGERGGVLLGVTFSLLQGVAGVIMMAVFSREAGGVEFGLVVGVASLLCFLRLPVFALEALFTWIVSALTRTGWLSPVWAAGQLPFGHHDLIFFPLPGLRSLLVKLGHVDAELGRSIIAQAAQSTGQTRPARLALEELQAQSLAEAGRERWFARVANLDLPSLLPVARQWLDLVAELRARLAEEMRRKPQVPTPFVWPGPCLARTSHGYSKAAGILSGSSTTTSLGIAAVRFGFVASAEWASRLCWKCCPCNWARAPRWSSSTSRV